MAVTRPGAASTSDRVKWGIDEGVTKRGDENTLVRGLERLATRE